jgi:RNA polymerase sigma factor (sigma-70 family)
VTFLKNISSQLSDQELITRYRETGNMALLADLYQRYMELVYGVCLKYMKEPEEAKDCVLNIFEELVTKLKKHVVENFKPWLYQLSKNHCLMKLRSRKSIPKHIDHELVHLEERVHLNEVFEKEAGLNRMEYCIEQLVTEQRQAIELFYLKEKSYQNIAEITGFDLNKVRSFIQNGRRNLKICMEKKATEKI